jgi:hypothetical protein
MKNNRVVVVSGATDIIRSPTETDATVTDVFDLTINSKINYAKKNGYDFLALRSFGNSKKYNLSEKEIGFLRVVRCYELLEKLDYDSVIWIDADSLITNHSYTIDHFVDEQTIFSASHDWNSTSYFSTGNFVINKIEQTESFFSLYFNNMKYFENEQSQMNVFYAQPDLKKYIKILDNRFLNSAPKQLEDTIWWRDRSKILKPWSSDCFLVHLTAISNRERIDIFNKHFKEFL